MHPPPVCRAKRQDQENGGARANEKRETYRRRRRETTARASLNRKTHGPAKRPYKRKTRTGSVTHRPSGARKSARDCRREANSTRHDATFPRKSLIAVAKEPVAACSRRPGFFLGSALRIAFQQQKNSASPQRRQPPITRPLQPRRQNTDTEQAPERIDKNQELNPIPGPTNAFEVPPVSL